MIRPIALPLAASPRQLLTALPLGLVAWGALAFGAVYPWAYWPLAIAAFASGTIGLVAGRSTPAMMTAGLLPLALVWLGSAIALQLVPLPTSVLLAISPRTVGLLRELNPAFAGGLLPRHPLSVWPGDTWIALALFASLAVLLVGTARLFSIVGCRRFVEALTVLGAALALVGIAQKSLSPRAIYGVWPLEPGRLPFGPFVNRNHFAGWMVMVLPLTLALILAGIDRGMRGLKHGWRHKVLWFSSPEASQLVLVIGAATLMALALMLTMSRSAITAFLLSLVLTGSLAAIAVDSRPRRVTAALVLAVLLLVVVTATGPEEIVSRFVAADWGEFNNRKGAWRDAWSVVREFPLAGTGLNTYWAAALLYQRHEITQFFAQAHNDYLQLVAEGGLLVTVPALVCLAIFLRDVSRAMRHDRGSTAWWLRAGAVTSLVAMAFQEMVEFSLQMPGNAALLAVICAVALHRPADPAPRGDGEALGGAGQRPRLRLVAPPARAS